MSIHNSFKRQPVPPQMARRYQTQMLPAPIRGISEIENWAYTKPGSAIALDNWFPTQKGLKLRGGTERWCVLPNPVQVVASGFEYVSGNNQYIFAATETRLFNVSVANTPVLIGSIGTITNGNFCAVQMATAAGDFLTILNDAGDFARRFDGTNWFYLNGAFGGVPTRINGGPAGAGNAATGMTYVWKYRNRLFFIQGGSMNAWFLPVNAVGGELQQIPLSGAFKRGGSLLFGASWSVDAGDGIDDKCVFVTDQGEVAIFTGTDPAVAANWAQQGRYDISKPLGKNAHCQLGGDILVATVDGIVPMSAVTTKDVSQLSLAAVTLAIEPMWMREFKVKNILPWTITKWDEGDMLLAAFPGGTTYETKTVAVSNVHTGAWSRFVGWDATCFMKLRGELFFGTQDCKIMQAESTGFDDAVLSGGVFVGSTYTCKMVGGWGALGSMPYQATWLQARLSFFSQAREPFEPQVSATTDFEYRIPAPPSAGPDPGVLDLWDQGLWDEALWDADPPPSPPPVRNTMWVSVGETGFTHAPIVQVTIGQQSKPDVELIAISATYEPLAANV